MTGLISTDLHQVDAALYRRCDQARSQAVSATILIGRALTRSRAVRGSGKSKRT
jgi:hypothetical protein